MSNLSGFVKRLRDIMRNDAGINGDAQRIEQMQKSRIGNGMMRSMFPLFQKSVAGRTGLLTIIRELL